MDLGLTILPGEASCLHLPGVCNHIRNGFIPSAEQQHNMILFLKTAANFLGGG